MSMEKSLASVRPELVKEWSDKNAPLKPEEVSYGSNKKIIWKGECGHEWTASVKSRVVNSTGCPYCSHNRILVGFNDLTSRYPEVAAEWSDKNLPLRPEQVTAFSNKRVWWKGKCGHEWYALISSRSDGHGCPYCETHKVLKGFNDFATLHPVLASEWSDKNGFAPDSIPENTPRLFWWKCAKCGGEYQAWTQSRIQGSKCPYCSGRVLLEGVNDLASQYPTIADEWNFEKNGDVEPNQVKARSKAVFWWKGECGHEWKVRVYDRTVGHQGCPKCEEEFLAVLPQLLVLLYAHRFDLKVLLQSDQLIGIPMEVSLPELRIAVDTEDMGAYTKKVQRVKEHLCRENGIRYALLKPSSSSAQIRRDVLKLLAYGHIYPKSSATEDIAYVKEQFFAMRERRRANERA